MRPLLLSDTDQTITDHRLLNHFTTEQALMLTAFDKPEIREMITLLDKNVPNMLHFVSKGYNLHEVFVDLMKHIGPARVNVISYSITELPLRILSQFLDKKIITELNFVLDFTVSRTPALAQFANHMATNIRYTDIHSKILIIENDDNAIVLVSSANFTRNNRYENGIIFSGKEFTEKYNEWFWRIFDGAKC